MPLDKEVAGMDYARRYASSDPIPKSQTPASRNYTLGAPLFDVGVGQTTAVLRTQWEYT